MLRPQGFGPADRDRAPLGGDPRPAPAVEEHVVRPAANAGGRRRSEGARGVPIDGPRVHPRAAWFEAVDPSPAAAIHDIEEPAGPDPGPAEAATAAALAETLARLEEKAARLDEQVGPQTAALAETLARLERRAAEVDEQVCPQTAALAETLARLERQAATLDERDGPQAAALADTLARLQQQAAWLDERVGPQAAALARLERKAATLGERDGPQAAALADAMARLERRATEVDERAAAIARALDAERARLERLAADRSPSSDEIEARAAAFARALDEQRARLEGSTDDRSAEAHVFEERAAVLTGVLEEQRARLQRLAAELSAREHEIAEQGAAHRRAFDNDRAWLERLAAELPTRARQLDDRVEAHLRTLDGERASLEGLARDLVARSHELDARAAAHMQAVEHERSTGPDEVRRSLAAMLPGLVADAVRLDAARRAERQPPPRPDTPAPRAEPDPVLEARQRSMEKRLDGLTRRVQEIDERVTTRLRAIDDDREVLADVVRYQDKMAQAIADADIDGRLERLVQWVSDAIPEAAAEAVDAAMKVKAAALSTAVGRVEKVRTETKAMADTVQESSERMLEALFRRDQDSAAQLQAMAEERAAITAMLEGGRDEIARSVVNNLPAMVEVAVRTAMERYATERRSGVQELTSRLRADSDVMREALQRSFEKMMEALATREQALDDRAGAHVKALELEKEEVADLWAKAARTVSDALPGLVADAVKAADQLDRAELEATRKEMEGLRAENEAAAIRLRDDQEATTAELREAVAELRAALVDRDAIVERQAAAYERAVASLRSAMARQPVRAAAAATERTPTPEPEPGREVEPSPTALVATVVDDTNGGRVKFGKSTVPRAQRVERRMLKIDDRDDAAWPALSRREAALSDFLAGKDD